MFFQHKIYLRENDDDNDERRLIYTRLFFLFWIFFYHHPSYEIKQFNYFIMFQVSLIFIIELLIFNRKNELGFFLLVVDILAG